MGVRRRGTTTLVRRGAERAYVGGAGSKRAGRSWPGRSRVPAVASVFSRVAAAPGDAAKPNEDYVGALGGLCDTGGTIFEPVRQHIKYTLRMRYP
jgi:hypothetical protein